MGWLIKIILKEILGFLYKIAQKSPIADVRSGYTVFESKHWFMG